MLDNIKNNIIHNKLFSILLISIIIVLIFLFINMFFAKNYIIEGYNGGITMQYKVIYEGESFTITCSGNHKYINIQSAFYGTGSRHIPITKILQERVDGKSSYTITANNSIAGDPYPGVRKHIHLYYFTSEKYLKSFTCGAGEQVNLSVDNNQIIKIVSATYGNFGARDYTTNFQNLVGNNSSYILNGGIRRKFGYYRRGFRKIFTVKYYGDVDVEKIKNDYEFVGYFNDRGDRGLDKYVNENLTLDDAYKKANLENATIIGFQDGRQLFYSTNSTTADFKHRLDTLFNNYGKTGDCNKDNKNMGCSWVNKVYAKKDLLNAYRQNADAAIVATDKAAADKAAADKADADRVAAEKVAAEKAAADRAAALAAIKYYNVGAGCSISCGFYFKNNNFSALVVTKENNNPDNYIENTLFNSINCFNYDKCNSNTLYSLVGNTVYSYKYTDKFNNVFQVTFNDLMNSNFLNCLKQLVTICTYIEFSLDIVDKLLIIHLSNTRKLKIKLLNVDTDTNIRSNLIVNNIDKMTYVINELTYYDIDLTKSYILGQIIYTATDFYYCILIV